MSDLISHKCPFCGATLEFDIGSQTVRCAYCDNEFSPDEFRENDEDLEYQDFELDENAGSEWSEKELYGLSEYQCESCGGDLYTDANTSATICPYCGNAVMLKGRLSGTLKPDRVIPFQKTKEEALEALRVHTNTKRFVHKGFLLDNKLEEIKGLYVPFWVYDAELEAEVTFNCVDQRTWTVGNTEFTERKYYRVVREGTIAFDHVPVDGSSKMPDDLMESIEPFEYEMSDDFTTSYLSGYVADKYDVDQDAARPRARHRMSEETVDEFETTVHYDEIRVSSVDIHPTRSEASYVMYPVWLMNTDWNGKKFTFAMNGQTGKIVGNLPADSVKLYGVSAILFTALFLVGLFIGLSDDEIGLGGAVFGLILGSLAFFVFSHYYTSKLKTVAFQHGASYYYRQGSMNITSKEDTFLHKTVTTRKLN